MCLNDDGPAFVVEFKGALGELLLCPVVHEDTGVCGSPLGCHKCGTPAPVVAIDDAKVTLRCPKCRSQSSLPLLIEPMRARGAA